MRNILRVRRNSVCHDGGLLCDVCGLRSVNSMKSDSSRISLPAVATNRRRHDRQEQQ
jgi:hypothetical protein